MSSSAAVSSSSSAAAWDRPARVCSPKRSRARARASSSGRASSPITTDARLAQSSARGRRQSGVAAIELERGEAHEGASPPERGDVLGARLLERLGPNRGRVLAGARDHLAEPALREQRERAVVGLLTGCETSHQRRARALELAHERAHLAEVHQGPRRSTPPARGRARDGLFEHRRSVCQSPRPRGRRRGHRQREADEPRAAAPSRSPDRELAFLQRFVHAPRHLGGDRGANQPHRGELVGRHLERGQPFAQLSNRPPSALLERPQQPQHLGSLLARRRRPRRTSGPLPRLGELREAVVPVQVAVQGLQTSLKRVEIPGVRAVGKRRDDIFVIGPQLLQPRAFAGRAVVERPIAREQALEEIPRVERLSLGSLAGLEAREGLRANRGMEREAPPRGPPDHRCVQELPELAQPCATNRGRGLTRERRPQDGERAQRRGRLRREQTKRRLERSAKARVTVRSLTAARLQQLRPALELTHDLDRIEQPQPRGRQLDAERAALHQRAHLGEPFPLRRVRLPAGSCPPRARERERAGVRRVELGSAGRLGHRRDEVRRLCGQREARAAGDQQRQAGAAADEPREHLPGIGDLLGVVAHDEHLAVAKPLDERGDDLFARADLAGRERREHRARERRRRLDRLEGHERDAIRKAVREPTCDLEREAGLADAPGAEEAHQARARRDRAAQLVDLALSADEGRLRLGQRRRLAARLGRGHEAVATLG
jgi:hypothetical protein